LVIIIKLNHKWKKIIIQNEEGMLEEAEVDKEEEEEAEEAEVVEVVITYQVEYQVTANGVCYVEIKRKHVGIRIQ